MAFTSEIEKQVQSFDFFKITDLGVFLTNLIRLGLIIASLAALFYLILGGIEYIGSGGNQDRTKSAKDKITNAIFGLGIAATAWVIWRLVNYFLGLSSTITGPLDIVLPTL